MSTIEKIAVYDARIIQEAPKYAVQKGALAVSVAPFNALAASASQHTYQVLVPSLNVFVDRKMDLSASATVYMDAVPSQYSTIAKTYTVPGASLLELQRSIIPGDGLAPTASSFLKVDLPQVTDAQGGAVDPDILTANSIISLRNIDFGTHTRTAGGANGSLSVTLGTPVSGLSMAKLSAFVTANGAGSLLITGTGLAGVVVESIVGNLVNLRTAVNDAGGAAGDYLFSTAVAPNLRIARTVYNSNDVYLYLPQFLGLVNGDMFTLKANAASSAVITCESGYIATPKLISKADLVEQAKEVVKPDGARGFGISTPYRIIFWMHWSHRH